MEMGGFQKQNPGKEGMPPQGKYTYNAIRVFLFVFFWGGFRENHRKREAGGPVILGTWGCDTQSSRGGWVFFWCRGTCDF